MGYSIDCDCFTSECWQQIFRDCCSNCCSTSSCVSCDTCNCDDEICPSVWGITGGCSNLNGTGLCFYSRGIHCSWAPLLFKGSYSPGPPATTCYLTMGIDCEDNPVRFHFNAQLNISEGNVQYNSTWQSDSIPGRSTGYGACCPAFGNYTMSLTGGDPNGQGDWIITIPPTNPNTFVKRIKKLML
jgi:hypothetical protein